MPDDSEQSFQFGERVRTCLGSVIRPLTHSILSRDQHLLLPQKKKRRGFGTSYLRNVVDLAGAAATVRPHRP